MHNGPGGRLRRIRAASVLACHPTTPGILVVEEDWWHLDQHGQPIAVAQDGWILDEYGEPTPSPNGTGFKYGAVISYPGGCLEQKERLLSLDSLASPLAKQLRGGALPRRYKRQIAAAEREVREETGYEMKIHRYFESTRLLVPELCRRLSYSFWVADFEGGQECPGEDIRRVLSLSPSELWFPELTVEVPWKFPFMAEIGQRWLQEPGCPVSLPFNTLSHLLPTAGN